MTLLVSIQKKKKKKKKKNLFVISQVPIFHDHHPSFPTKKNEK